MSYKIVVDSCCDLPVKYRKDPHFEVVPLSLSVGSWTQIDDDTFDQAEFLRVVRESPECPKSACPSPERYMKAYETDADDVIVVTLTSKLSGSYNSALLGKNLYEEEIGKKNIFLCDSLSACCGEAQCAIKAMELEEAGLSFEEVCAELTKYRDHMRTWFVLDSLEHLRKNGRLSNWKAFMATTLNIKPICAGDEGIIVQKAQGVGMKKAMLKMCELITRDIGESAGDKRLMISHCNCFERAKLITDTFLKDLPFKDTMIVDTAGCASMYAQDGGIVVTY